MNITKNVDRKLSSFINDIKLQLGDVALHVQEIETEIVELRKDRDELRAAVAAHGHQMDELLKLVNSRTSTRAAPTAASSTYMSIDGSDLYPKDTLCVFAVPLPEGGNEVGGVAAKDSVAQKVAEAADIPRSDIKDVKPLGSPVKRDNKLVQAWKLIFKDNHTAFETLKRKKQVRRRSGIRLEEDLTIQQRAVKDKRRWAFTHLQKKHDQLWVQWRFDELYINQTRVLDEMRDENGDIIVNNRGFWTKLGEQDYQKLAEEILDERQREAATSEEREGAVGGEEAPQE